MILGMIQFVVFLDSASDKMFMKLQILMKVNSIFFDKYTKKISEKSLDHFFTFLGPIDLKRAVNGWYSEVDNVSNKLVDKFQ